ncbi:protein spire homolog 1 isoform X6 [Danio rerio]|uniref:Protein spire homolog 1 n=1 Tax=Danio rerio TaxID=7955 RepID=SPIR1_DANRE|nr:protein spire homolog 1 isoform X6 [Danio rerio]Q1LYM3.1 RecName: Full=Protein spire homolog 1 [Danio rerio]|eukprot:XP_005159679.1 protein spire homolog 1 isoform X6 [Danio rerio]
MTDGGMLISPSALQDPGDGARPEDIAMDCTDGEEELCLEEILTLYSQPINEEQAWAVCYQCCRWLTQKHRRKETGVSPPGRIAGPGDVRIRKDGNVKLYQPSNPDKHTPPSSSIEIIESLGIMIYKALDYGLKEHEERELSPPLEQLIDLMTNMADTETDCPDEGYEATEEEDEGEEENAEVSNVRGYRDIISLCLSHLPSPSDAPNHYQAVCRALYAETKELRTFLEKIKSAKENLRKMEGETEEPVRDLNELQNADWARFWVQVMRDLRHGVKLKKVQERQYNPLAIEYQLTPYEMLMDDIRSKRYKLRKVMVNGDIPPRLKKSAHEIILEFIRSRPPLNPVSARKLKPHAPQPPTLHERILEEIRSERKLRPVSPDMIRRSRLGAGKSISTPQDLFRSSDIPDGPRKLAISTLSLANGTSPARSPVNGVAGGHSLSQRKRLLKAPTLAELDSSDSEEEQSTRKSDSSSSISTSLVEDTSPESVMGKKPPPQFLPISSTPQPDKRIAPQRRHSIEKEAPTNIRHFLPPSRQNSKSLAHALGSGHAEEFCFPVECLTLTVEEVMHIRQVLVKAELEKFQQYKDIYNALKKGKLCFSCRSKKFSLFTWSYTCQFCKRPVCSQCCKKMKLPSKPHASLPISSLGPSILPKKEPGASSAPTDKTSSTSSHKKNSLQRSLSRSSKHGDRSSSKDELELPEQFTEDWSTMEVCVDCKKFINDIISNSRRNLSTKRARLHRRTHSVYSSSTSSSNYKPTERTIKEV